MGIEWGFAEVGFCLDPLSVSSITGTSQWVAMPCGWKGKSNQ